MGKRIVVTGGSGAAGQHVIAYLLDQGHDILNIDLVPIPDPRLAERVHTLRADLSDSGQTFNALCSHFHLTEPFREPLRQLPDAVVHLAGYARNMMVPDNETFRGNALSMYNIVEAACRLGIRKVIFASSITVYGVSFAEGDVDYPSFPVDEEVDANPMDTYAISKVCGERIARGFARRFGVDIYVLRLGRVVAPHEYAEDMFRSYVQEPERWKAHGWSYIDARDLGQICDRAVATDGLGYQIFNAVNDTITNNSPSTVEFLKSVAPQTPITRDMGQDEAPVSNRKVRELLGFKENHPWRRYYSS
ncbi:NAD(P)-binding protein [Aspergillus ellipticus CBS 707.79]|uniref:NAD(P)-binding protein n=1 Tax=Aspergillus ellipticus CBS 707.79 TaxID=1448320 RepID=A0A319CWY0_9EURO|nr:NAD(P)-binding protein [Aspergillus ellipticus CBS 707.79]